MQGTYPDLKTSQKNAQYLLDGIGSRLKWVWNGGAWVVEQGGRIFAKKQSKKSGKESANNYPSQSNFEPPRKDEKNNPKNMYLEYQMKNMGKEIGKRKQIVNIIKF